MRRGGGNFRFIVLKFVSYILGMDTIIYFYQKRDPVQREISLMYQEDYLFAKVGICTDRRSWFGCPLPDAPVPVEESEAGQAGALSAAQIREEAGEKRGPAGWLKRRRAVRESRRRLKKRQQEYMQQMQEYEEHRRELIGNILKLREEVFSEIERAGGMDDIRCVYEDSLRFLIEGHGEAALCWNQVWDLREFCDYKKMRWVLPLLEYAEQSDYIILGKADCIPEILKRLARQMKSLRWYLAQEDLDEETESWTEDFYEEYGLAVTLQGLAERNALRKLKLTSENPVCVLDFTEEGIVFAGNLAGGSIWLDFAAAEKKAGRICRQAPEVRYMSLKRYWGAKTKRKPIFARSFGTP